MQDSETDIASIDLAALAGRVRQLLLAAELDGTDFAARIGVPYGTMRAYLSGNRPPSAEFLTGCFRAFGFLPEWVLTGEGAMTRGGSNTVSELVPIQRLEYGSKGAGSPVSVSREWLSKRNLNAANLRALNVRGSSMQGALSDGDLVIIDLADTRPQSGFIYALRQRNEVLVKYCEELPGGVLRVSSANGAFAPYDVDMAKAPADFEVTGRVVASLHDW